MYNGKEHNFQKAIAKYLDLRLDKCQWAHIPNEGKRTPKTGAHLKKQGMKAGILDNFIFLPRQGKNGFAFELKVGKNKPPQLQQEWIESLNNMNWQAGWYNDIDDCIKAIDDYLK